MARYWVGDLHLGHKKVAEIRYPDAPESPKVVTHHDMVIYNQLKRLNADDQVWVMGDISSGKPEDEDRALQLLSEIDAKLHLIAGNHDSVSGIHRNGYKQQRRWLEVFESVQDYTRVKLHGKQVLMHHYPRAWAGDGPERPGARYKEWRLNDTGMRLIHAHTHQTTPHMSFPAQVRTIFGGVVDTGNRLDTTQMCVSWDVRRGLATEHELTEWAKTLPK